MARKRQLFALIIIIFTELLSVMGGVLGNLATSTPLPRAILPYLRFAWPIFGVVTLLSIGFTIWQGLHGEDHIHSPSTSLNNQNRHRLLSKVSFFWITGVLDQSLQEMARINLELQEQQDVIVTPRQLVTLSPSRSSHALPLGKTSITRIYQEAGEELLILGEPGSGKTTLLLELARALIEEAKHDETLPIPVIFNLSSWARKQLPITNWLAEELHSKYQVPRQLSQVWVDTEQILPLLDGLDEVPFTHRGACIEALNSYRQNHGLLPIVICSRSKDYLAQKLQLVLHSAVTIQPLTTKQVDDYFSQVGEPLKAVHAIWHQDPDLQELVTTPLLLSVLTLAYQGQNAKDLVVETSPEQQRQRIFAMYIKRMLQQRETKMPYTPKQTIHWLSWLAQQLVRQTQTEFFLEGLQYDWLPQRTLQQFYLSLHSLLQMLMGALIGGLMGELLVDRLLNGFMSGLFNDKPSGLFIYGLVGGLMGFLLSKRQDQQENEQKTPLPGRNSQLHLVNVAKYLKNGHHPGNCVKKRLCKEGNLRRYYRHKPFL